MHGMSASGAGLFWFTGSLLSVGNTIYMENVGMCVCGGNFIRRTSECNWL